MQSNTLNIKQIVVRLMLGAGISFTMLAILLYAFSGAGQDINLSRLIDLMRNVSLLGLGWYLITQLIGVGLRSLRYQALLDAAGDQSCPSLKDLFPITLVRNMTVDLLPARVGELVFVGLLKRIKNTHVTHSLTALVFATLFDIAVILPVVVILAVFILTQTQTQLTLVSGALILIVALVIVFYAMKILGPYVSHKITQLSSYYDNRLLNKLAKFIEELNQAVQLTIAGRQFKKVIWVTVALRITKYLGLCLLFIGVVRSSYPHLADLPIGQLVSILIAGETAASLPIPTFLSLGSYEAGSAGMLTLFGVDLANAVLIMLAVHLCSQIIDYTLGLLGVAWLLARQPKGHAKHQQSVLSSVLTGIIVLASAIALFYGWQATRKAWSVNAPPAGNVISATHEHEKIADWNSRPGFIVWSSNRNGGHEHDTADYELFLWQIDSDPASAIRLTFHSGNDSWPDIYVNH